MKFILMVSSRQRYYFPHPSAGGRVERRGKLGLLAKQSMHCSAISIPEKIFNEFI
jgi:hypothetical protein